MNAAFKKYLGQGKAADLKVGDLVLLPYIASGQQDVPDADIAKQREFEQNLARTVATVSETYLSQSKQGSDGASMVDLLSQQAATGATGLLSSELESALGSYLER